MKGKRKMDETLITDTTDTEASEVKEKGKPKLHDYHLVYIGVMMVIASLLGWVSENVFRVITVGIIDSRFMYLPFLGIYGLCILALYGLFGTPDRFRFLHKRILDENGKSWVRYICYCLVIAAAVMIGEIAVGSFCEAFSGKILWNYSSIPLHFTKYTSVPTTAAITAGVFLLMKFGFTPLMDLMERKLSYKSAKIICLTLWILVYLDTAWFMVRIVAFGDAGFIWKITLID